MLSLELHFLFLLFSSQLLSGYLSLMPPQCPANNFSLLVALCSAFINTHSLRSQKSFSSGGAIPLSVSSPFSPPTQLFPPSFLPSHRHNNISRPAFPLPASTFHPPLHVSYSKYSFSPPPFLSIAPCRGKHRPNQAVHFASPFNLSVFKLQLPPNMPGM